MGSPASAVCVGRQAVLQAPWIYRNIHRPRRVPNAYSWNIIIWYGILQVYSIVWYSIEDSKKVDYGPRTIYAGVPSSQACGVGGQSYSNFLVSTVQVCFRFCGCPYKERPTIWGLYSGP